MSYTNNFSFTGTVFNKKEDDTHKNKNISKSESGWVSHRFRFGMKSGGSYHDVVVSGGYKDSPDALVYYLTNNKEKRTCKFAHRKSVDPADVAPYCLYTLDLNEYKKADLKKASEDEQAAAAMSLTKERATELLNHYDDKNYRFLSAVDLAVEAEKLVADPAYKGKMFDVTGNVVCSEYKGKTITQYEVRKIALAHSEEDRSTTNIYFLLNEDSLGDVEDDGSFVVTGWTSQYDSKTKGQKYFPYSFRVPKIVKETEEDTERANRIRRKRFAVKGDTIKECVVTTKVVNGTEFREITEEDLTEDERDAIFCGEVTFEDLKREYRRVAGPTVRENQFVKMGIGYTKGGPVETSLTMDEIYGIAHDDDDDDIDDLFAD